MAVITYTDSFVRANVAKLSLDSSLWVGVLNGKGLSIRSNKLLTTWQDILDGFHNPDSAICSPTSMPLADSAFYTGRQSGSLTFDSSVHVSMDNTDPALTLYVDSFNRATGALGALWASQFPSGTFSMTVSTLNTVRFQETFLGTLAAFSVTTQMSAVLNQHCSLTYKSGTPAYVGPSVRHTGTAVTDKWYGLDITGTAWQLNQHSGTNSNSNMTAGSLTLAANDVFKITAIDDGTGVNVSAYQNGTLLGTVHRTFVHANYIGAGKPGMSKSINSGAMDCFFDNWSAGAVAAPAATATQVSTEINFYEGVYGVGYAENEDSPSSHTYTAKVYVFTDDDYSEVNLTLVHGDVLSGLIEIVDDATCNVVAKVNGVVAVRIDGAARITGRPYLFGTGTSPEQYHYVNGTQSRSEQVWSSATLSLEASFVVADETTRTSIATCVRSTQKSLYASTQQQAAWGKWKFSGTLRAYSVIDNTLVLSIQRGTDLFIETIDISPVPGTRFLDCEILSADIDAPILDAGVTTWDLGFDIPVDPEHPLAVVNTGTGKLIPSLVRAYSNKISATGDFTATNVAIGLLYPTQWELSTIFLTEAQPEGSTIALTDGHLQIRHIEFNYSATGEFTVTVIPNTDDGTQSYEYTFDGTSNSEKGTFRAPVFGQNSKAQITVGGTSHRPFSISNFSWTGYISQITKRV